MNKIKTFLNKYRVLMIIGTLFLIVVIIGQNILGKEDATSTGSTSTASVTKGDITSTVSASGNIETANYLAVTTSVNGIVKKVYVQEGDTVTKGQKIMEITLNSDGEESLASAYSSYLSAKSSLERAKNDLLTKESSLLNATNNFEDVKETNSYQTSEERDSYKLAENSYLVAKSEYDLQQDAITQAQVSLNKAWLSYQAQSSTIVAPESGTIANILIVEGMDISNSLSERTSATVASIRKEGTPIASLNITEVDINKIKVGQKVVMTLNSIDNKEFTGTVVGIDKIGSSSSGVSNYPIIVKFDEDSDLVLPNMGVDADIIIESKSDALVVPTSAISSSKNKKTLTVINNGTPETVNIETGISNDKYTEVLSGVNEGDIVQVKSLPTEGFTTSSNQGGEVRMPGVGGFMR